MDTGSFYNRAIEKYLFSAAITAVPKTDQAFAKNGILADQLMAL